MAECWNWSYKLSFTAGANDRKAAGIRAFKQELIFNGFSHGIIIDMPSFGKYAVECTKNFQEVSGLVADGVLGPITARYLFRQRCQEIETLHGIPGALLRHMKSQESFNDPVAEGFADPDDEGLMQVNVKIHNTLALSDLWDPPFALELGAKMMVGAHSRIGDWDGAVAAWNCGEYYAKKWVVAGKPVSGLIVDDIDWFARAFRYVGYVKNSAI